ncbi:hypothetical protein [Paenibacillus harenae]|uniref:SMI1/KNR4 family protein n=1 Tax=Paenibacillus harenae TaxID=306543 RepID=A0ABT9U6U2_PAEHA|nr:hypothetical protein [Paenibacillus harenae]MDQ0115348.1 hypothetical protein [Paenibacillus harenae]
MDKQSAIALIMKEMGLLTGKHRNQIEDMLEIQFDWQEELTEAGLLGWEESKLQTLYQVMKGVQMTREYVPNILQSYANVNHHQIPSKVQFGRIRESDKPVLVLPPKEHDQYGKYDVPQSVIRLYELEQELGSDMDFKLGLLMQKQDFRYHCTPPDFIPFASPGMDGIHFCFVTDFGTVDDLENAYIAAVSPMDFDNEIWIVARNIMEFLRIVSTDRSVLYNNYGSGEAYLADVKRRERKEPDEAQRKAVSRLKQFFGIEAIDDLASHIDEVKAERAARVRLHTLDSVGVMAMSDSPREGEPRMVAEASECPELTEHAFDEADAETKLASIRNLQYKKIIPEDRKMLLFCMRTLAKLGLSDERNRLRKLGVQE